MTRVLQLLTRMNIGGPSHHVLALCRGSSSEFVFHVAAGTPEAGEGLLANPNVPVTDVGLARPIRPLTDARSFGLVRRHLVDLQPDLINTHMAKAGLVGRLAAGTLRPRPRTVHTYHGHVLEGYFREPMSRAFVQVERQLARSTDLLIAVSAEIRDQLLELGIGRPEQYRVVPVARDLTGFLEMAPGDAALRRQLGIPGEAPLVAAIGRLAPVKDLGVLLRAVAEVEGAHLVVVGDGPDRTSLTELSRALQLADRVHFTGWMDDVRPILATCDVVALTSTNEGTPVSLIEAGAAGVPVVATDVGGVPTVVRHGGTGLLVRPGDIAGVSDGIRLLLGSRSMREEMGDAARRHVSDAFDLRRSVAGTFDCYREVLGGLAPA